jgi:hypothetical protein
MLRELLRAFPGLQLKLLRGSRAVSNPDLRGRRTQGLSGSDYIGVSADRGSDLHRAFDPQQSGGACANNKCITHPHVSDAT